MKHTLVINCGGEINGKNKPLSRIVLRRTLLDTGNIFLKLTTIHYGPSSHNVSQPVLTNLFQNWFLKIIFYYVPKVLKTLYMLYTLLQASSFSKRTYMYKWSLSILYIYIYTLFLKLQWFLCAMTI